MVPTWYEMEPEAGKENLQKTNLLQLEERMIGLVWRGVLKITENMPSSTLPHLTRKAVLVLAASLGFPQQTLLAADASTIPVTILADTNRDGRVDGLDAYDKHTWTSDRGAIFLPNTGDGLHRCYSQDAVGAPLSNQELAACNDAAGDVLINSTLAAPVKTMPVAGLSPDATARVLVQPAHAAEHVRVFWRHVNDGASSAWAPVQPELIFNSTSLAAGLTLAVDARHLVSDAAAWDGLINMTVEVTDGARSGSDSVAMRQAPVLVHHHLQAPDTVVTMQTREGRSLSQAAFVAALDDVLGHLDPPLPLLVLNDTDDVWAQDIMEPAYASMPGPDGPISIRVLLRSAQSTRPDGRRVFTQLRGSGVGGWQPGPGSGFGFEEINSGGNIETIPPYTSRSGIRYANGRVVLGKHFAKYPAASVLRFLEAQREQTPLFVETGWLAAGHVDEMLQFLPSDSSPPGFAVAVPDSRSALDTLRRMQQTGHGAAPFLTYAGDMESDRHAIFADPSLRNTTVDALLADAGFLATNAYGQRFVDRTVAQLLAELPMREADVVRVPALWKDSSTLSWPTDEEDGVPPRIPRAAPGERQLQSIFPLALNGLVLGGRDYLAPRPFGPRMDGVDVLEREIGRVYAAAGMKVIFMDDYMSHHVRGGEIHCGTNTLRRTDVEWWKTQ